MTERVCHLKRVKRDAIMACGCEARQERLLASHEQQPAHLLRHEKNARRAGAGVGGQLAVAVILDVGEVTVRRFMA